MKRELRLYSFNITKSYKTKSCYRQKPIIELLRLCWTFVTFDMFDMFDMLDMFDMFDTFDIVENFDICHFLHLRLSGFSDC